MAIKTKEELKAYFLNGKVPSEVHYSDLMDTIFSLVTEFPGIANQFLNGLGNFVQINWNDLSGKPATFSPSAHGSSHSNYGIDPIKLDDLSTPDNNTDLNATTARHGLLPRLSGVASQGLLGNGLWGNPSPASHQHNASDILTGVFLQTTPIVGVVRRRASALPISGSGNTTISYTEEMADSYGNVVPNLNGYLYAPVSGYYVISGHVEFDSVGNVNYWRGVFINTNNNYGVLAQSGGQGYIANHLMVSAICWLNAGEYVYLRVYESTGTRSVTNADFSIGKLS